MKIGAQLYTVREHAKTLEDFAKTLERVAEIGYTVVQVSGTCAFEPKWLKEQLDRLGLICPLTHYSADRIANDTMNVISEHKAFDCKHIGIGSLKNGLKNGMDDYNNFVRDYKEPAKLIAQNGQLFMYHNHDFEFARYGGVESKSRLTYLEKLAQDFSPEEMGFTLDTYWIQSGGGNPTQWIKDFSGRVPCVHLKDMACENRERRMAPIYEGNMDFDSIISACESAGTQYLLVEQDHCYGEDPFVCLKKSYDNLAAKGLR